MAEDDIYGSKKRWKRFVENYIDKKKILQKPNKKDLRKYYCKNKDNLRYYQKLIRSFEVNDLSYVRRLRIKDVLNFLTHFIECDLKNANSLEKEDIIIQIRKTISPSQLRKTQTDVRMVGKILFEEKERPNFFKEFEIKTDVSRQIARKDKLTIEEFDRLMKFLSLPYPHILLQLNNL